MIQLTGKLLDVTSARKKDFETGELSINHTCEILHKRRGKSVIEALTLDSSVTEAWLKAIGREITVEIDFYAMKTREGAIRSGPFLVDKKSLPTVHRPAAQAA